MNGAACAHALLSAVLKEGNAYVFFLFVFKSGFFPCTSWENDSAFNTTFEAGQPAQNDPEPSSKKERKEKCLYEIED